MTTRAVFPALNWRPALNGTVLLIRGTLIKKNRCLDLLYTCVSPGRGPLSHHPLLRVPLALFSHSVVQVLNVSREQNYVPAGVCMLLGEVEDLVGCAPIKAMTPQDEEDIILMCGRIRVANTDIISCRPWRGTTAQRRAGTPIYASLLVSLPSHHRLRSSTTGRAAGRAAEHPQYQMS